MIRLGARSLLNIVKPRVSIRAISHSTVRFNAGSKSHLASQVFPINKQEITDTDVDEWLSALKRLRDGHAPDNETEVYIKELTETEEHLKQEFTPTDQQLQEQEKFLHSQVPVETIPVVDQLVNLIMRDGKKSKARRIVSRALYIVYLKLRKDPVLVLKETLDQLSPLLATKTEKTGTAKNRIVPYPLSEKQRYRYAYLWMLDGAAKKKSSDFSVRLAEEIINSFEGKSSGYEKRAQMHKVATAQRAYVRL